MVVVLIDENSTARIGVLQRSQRAQLMTGASRPLSVLTAITREKGFEALCSHFSNSMRLPRLAATGCVLNCSFCSSVSLRLRQPLQVSP
jgi:hypothetical protein